MEKSAFMHIVLHKLKYHLLMAWMDDVRVELQWGLKFTRPRSSSYMGPQSRELVQEDMGQGVRFQILSENPELVGMMLVACSPMFHEVIFGIEMKDFQQAEPYKTLHLHHSMTRLYKPSRPLVYNHFNRFKPVRAVGETRPRQHGPARLRVNETSDRLHLIPL